MSHFSYSLRRFVWCDFILLFHIFILLITTQFFSYLIYAFCLCLIHSCVDILFMHCVISFISLYLFRFFLLFWFYIPLWFLLYSFYFILISKILYIYITLGYCYICYTSSWFTNYVASFPFCTFQHHFLSN